MGTEAGGRSRTSTWGEGGWATRGGRGASERGGGILLISVLTLAISATIFAFTEVVSVVPPKEGEAGAEPQPTARSVISNSKVP